MADQVASVLCMEIDPSCHLVCGALYEPCFCYHSLSVTQSRGGYRRSGEPVASKFQQTDRTLYEGLLNNSATKIQIGL